MPANPLIGTWWLVSWELRDAEGRVTYPWGRDPVGFITYTADGRMAVQFGRSDRAQLHVADWLAASDAEIVAAARGYFAYCGTYECRDDTVVHRLDFCLMPNWIGGEQVRQVALSGDTVTLFTPPTQLGGQQRASTRLAASVKPTP